MLKQLKSFLKAIWGNIWPTVKQRKKNSINFHSNLAKGLIGSDFKQRDWREENKKIVENFKGCFDPGFHIQTSTVDEIGKLEDTMRECRDIPENIDGHKLFPLLYDTDNYRSFVHHWQMQLNRLQRIISEPLSGEVSEQSVILPKMDEVMNPIPRKRVDLVWDCDQVIFHYTPHGKYLVGCDPYGDDVSKHCIYYSSVIIEPK